MTKRQKRDAYICIFCKLEGKRPFGDLGLDKRIIKFWGELGNCLLAFEMTQRTMLCPTVLLLCVFIATGMYLLGHCLEMIRGHGEQANSSGSVGGVFSAAQPKLI
jgi:hypothetical protein